MTELTKSASSSKALPSTLNREAVKLPLMLESGQCLWMELVPGLHEPMLILSLVDGPFGERAELVQLTVPDFWVINDLLTALRKKSVEWVAH